MTNLVLTICIELNLQSLFPSQKLEVVLELATL